MIAAEDSDLYDVLTFIASARAPVSRAERVETQKDFLFAQHSNNQQNSSAFSALAVNPLKSQTSARTSRRDTREAGPTIRTWAHCLCFGTSHLPFCPHLNDV